MQHGVLKGLLSSVHEDHHFCTLLDVEVDERLEEACERDTSCQVLFPNDIINLDPLGYGPFYRRLFTLQLIFEADCDTHHVYESALKVINPSWNDTETIAFLAFLENAWPVLEGQAYQHHDAQIPVHEQLTFQGYIGGGAFGRVFHVTGPDHESYALKVVSKASLADPIALELLKREVNIMKALSGDRRFAQLHASFADERNVHLAMSLYRRGTLYDVFLKRWCFRIGKVPGFSPHELQTCGAELLDSIEAMQQRHVLHRDIKLENVLVDDDGHLVICDFGLSFQGSKASAAYLSGSHKYVGRRGNLDNICCGTWELLPPEALASHPYGFEVDVWSWGVAMYLMAVGAYPWTGETTQGIISEIESGLKFPRGVYIDPVLKDLLRKVLRPDKRKRYSIQGIKDHPYFSNVSWMAISSRTVPLFRPLASLAAVSYKCLDDDIDSYRILPLTGTSDDSFHGLAYGIAPCVLVTMSGCLPLRFQVPKLLSVAYHSWHDIVNVTPTGDARFYVDDIETALLSLAKGSASCLDVGNPGGVFVDSPSFGVIPSAVRRLFEYEGDLSVVAAQRHSTSVHEGWSECAMMDHTIFAEVDELCSPPSRFHPSSWPYLEDIARIEDKALSPGRNNADGHGFGTLDNVVQGHLASRLLGDAVSREDAGLFLDDVDVALHALAAEMTFAESPSFSAVSSVVKSLFESEKDLIVAQHTSASDEGWCFEHGFSGDDIVDEVFRLCCPVESSPPSFCSLPADLTGINRDLSSSPHGDIADAVIKSSTGNMKNGLGEELATTSPEAVTPATVGFSQVPVASPSFDVVPLVFRSLFELEDDFEFIAEQYASTQPDELWSNRPLVGDEIAEDKADQCGSVVSQPFPTPRGDTATFDRDNMHMPRDAIAGINMTLDSFGNDADAAIQGLIAAIDSHSSSKTVIASPSFSVVSSVVKHIFASDDDFDEARYSKPPLMENSVARNLVDLCSHCLASSNDSSFDDDTGGNTAELDNGNNVALKPSLRQHVSLNSATKHERSHGTDLNRWVAIGIQMLRECDIEAVVLPTTNTRLNLTSAEVDNQCFTLPLYQARLSFLETPAIVFSSIKQPIVLDSAWEDLQSLPRNYEGISHLPCQAENIFACVYKALWRLNPWSSTAPAQALSAENMV